MDSLSDTTWDVVISGTGIQQSLLALALSRSGKKILHVDQNEFYGGPDAALSLQEAEAWVNRVEASATLPAVKNASISKHSPISHDSGGQSPELSFSRAYSLSLSPHIVYTRSKLLEVLVSSKVYRQLEFQALGSWWIYKDSAVSGSPAETPSKDEAADSQEHSQDVKSEGLLKRVPSGREDIFTDTTIDLRSKRLLMKFLKFVADFEDQQEIWSPHAALPFTEFLASQFSIPAELHLPLLAIATTPYPYRRTTTAFALPRIARHLRSIGMFGPGFGAVIPKWGGGAEIAQVACRAGAVGGAVYMLGNDISSIIGEVHGSDGDLTEVHLRNGERIRTRWTVRSSPRRAGPADTTLSNFDEDSESQQLRSIYIVSSPMSSLFTTVAEGGPQPAGAVILFPFKSLDPASADLPPVHVVAHSSDTGECPSGQCVLYASVMSHEGVTHELLDRAIERLLSAVKENPQPQLLYTLRYTLSTASPSKRAQSTQPDGPSAPTDDNPQSSPGADHLIEFPPPALDLVFDDNILAQVHDAWKRITQPPPQLPQPSEPNDDDDSPKSPDEFMRFEDREGQLAGAAEDADDDG